ncbi:MAG: sigma 54-interacting transcriptional regulator [Chitinophagaceae bacterium]
MPWIAARFQKNLAGSELFGHVKGAFTGAIVDKEGHFELS